MTEKDPQVSKLMDEMTKPAGEPELGELYRPARVVVEEDLHAGLCGPEPDRRHNESPLPPLTGMRPSSWPLSFVLGMLACGCFHHHSGDSDGGASCSSGPPSCVQRAAGPCGPLELVSPSCEDDVWLCPPGAYEHSSGMTETCRPLADSLELLHVTGPTVEVGGRCVVVANADVTVGDGEDRVTVELPEPFAFRECLDGAVGEPLLDRSDVGPDVIVDLTDTIRIAGSQFSFVRLFEVDLAAPFGLRSLGGQVVRHDADGSYRPTSAMMWDDGNYRSAVVAGESVYVYENGRGVPGLVGGAIVYRTDARRLLSPGEWERWGGSGWGLGEPVAVVDVGPQFHVSERAGGFLLLTAEGFGDSLMVLTSSRPEGPWRSAGVHPCELPADDAGAFCDSIRAYPSMQDPERPTELVLGYRIGTTSADAMERVRRDPAAYWGRMLFIDTR